MYTKQEGTSNVKYIYTWKSVRIYIMDDFEQACV